jgi:transposase
MTAIVTIGIDLAKNVFAVHGVDATGKPALVRPSVPRAKLLELIATLPPCLIGMEACSGAHQAALVTLSHSIETHASGRTPTLQCEAALFSGDCARRVA